MSSSNEKRSVSIVPKIDIHTHILPKNWPNWNEKFGYDGWLTIEHDDDGTARMMNSNGKIFRIVEENCWSPTKRIIEMNEKGVAVQVVCTVPGTGFNYHVPAADAVEVAQYLNDHLHGIIQEFPTRFIGLGTLPMQDTNLAIQELRRCINELHFHGIQIGSHINGKNLESPDLEAFWTEVESLNCAVFIHPWYMGTEERLTKHWFQWTLGMPHETAIAMSSLIFGGVLERHPTLKLCFAHGGGSFPLLIGRLTHGFDVRPDLCQTCNKQQPETYLHRLYLDSLVHDPDVLKLIVKKFGNNRVIMGTDYPFPLGEIDAPGKLIEDVFDADLEMKHNLLWRNAVEFLNLSPQFQQQIISFYAKNSHEIDLILEPSICSQQTLINNGQTISRTFEEDQRIR
jgi:aminocarboxymuconate-semialdehyde decarboxylase